MKEPCPKCGGKKRHVPDCTEKWTRRGPHRKLPAYGVIDEFKSWMYATSTATA